MNNKTLMNFQLLHPGMQAEGLSSEVMPEDMCADNSTVEVDILKCK